MGFYRWRNINGRSYLYYEERYREHGKVKSRSKLISSKRDKEDQDRKNAVERYRDVLRENVYRYGKNHPGERYRKEAEARAAYHRYLDARAPDSIKSRFEDIMVRAVANTPQLSPDRPVDVPVFLPKGSPTDEEEAMHATWSENQKAEMAEQEAVHAESAPDVDAPAAEGEG